MTDYFYKYTKYKTKYINLKTQVGGSDNFIVNMMWINDVINDVNTFIFPETTIRKDSVTKEEKIYNYFDMINGWLDKDYEVYFWYDITTISIEQLKKTQKIFIGKNISFRSIIDIINSRNDAILTCNIYLKVDYLRLYLLNYLIQYEPRFQYYIYTDMLLTAKTKIELSEEQNLDIFRFVTLHKIRGEKGNNAFENGFIAFKFNRKSEIDIEIIKKYDDFVIKSLEYAILGDTSLCYGVKEDPKNQYFYNVISLLTKLIISIIFYPDNIPELNNETFDTIDKININVKSIKGDYIHELPHYTLPFLSAPRKKLYNSSTIEDQKKYFEVNKIENKYLYPVIDFDRPIGKGSY